MTKPQSVHLDMIRGVAALAVLISHVRGLFLADFRDVVANKRMLLPFYTITGLGNQAVMIFFVLSGFLIGGSVLAAKGNWNWKQYSISRLTRLYVVLLPALLLTAVLDRVAQAAPGGHVYFDFPIKNFNKTPFILHQSLSVFMGNVFFLQTIRVLAFGANSPLWSLANEFWYYVLFPLLAVALLFRRNTGLVWRIAAAGFAVLLFVWLPGRILWGFVMWLLGVVVYKLPGIRLRVTSRLICILAAGAVFASTLVLSRGKNIPEKYDDFAVALTFALFLTSLLILTDTSGEGISSRYQSCARFLSGCSFSVYAVHFPVVILIRCLAGTKVWQPNALGLSIWAAVSCVAFLAGYGFSLLTEAHTGTVRHFVSGYVLADDRLNSLPSGRVIH